MYIYFNWINLTDRRYVEDNPRWYIIEPILCNNLVFAKHVLRMSHNNTVITFFPSYHGV